MAAHRYWRLYIIRVTGDGYKRAVEVEMRASIGGSNECGSGSASASTTFSGYSAADAFDGDAADNGWASNSDSTDNYQWLKYDFGSGNDVEINELAITINKAYNNGPIDFVLQYSDDDSTWTDWIWWCSQSDWDSGTGYQTRTFNKNTTGAVWGDNFAPKNMTSNSAPSPNVASASTEYSAQFPAYKAFYGLFIGTQRYWSASTTTGWLKIDLGSGNADTAEKFVVRINTMSETNRAPKDFTLQGSNNDSDWTTLGTYTGESSWSNGEGRIFTLSTTGSYRYYKLDITDNNGGSLVHVAELYLINLHSAGSGSSGIPGQRAIMVM